MVMEIIYQRASQYAAYSSTPGRIYGTEYHVSGNTRSGCDWRKDPGRENILHFTEQFHISDAVNVYNEIGEIYASKSS